MTAAFNIEGICIEESKGPGTYMAVFNVGSSSRQKAKASVTILACLEPTNHFAFLLRVKGR
jgi:hypothetical protein